MEPFKLLAILSAAVYCVGSERILAILPFPGRSHFAAFQPLLEGLARRGHHVTVVSAFPRTTPLENYTDIYAKPGIDFGMYDLTKMDGGVSPLMWMIFDLLDSFAKLFEDERVVSLLNPNKTDLVMTELFFTDMFVGISHKLRVPLIEMSSASVVPWGTDRFGIPDNPSYIRMVMNKGAGPMSFYDRVANCFYYILTKSLYSLFVTSRDDDAIKKYLGSDMPHIDDIMKRSSLLLVNSHFSLSEARPLPPQVVEIGGVHIKPAKTLPQDIEKFINESEHGVVYFSLGSLANASSMTEEKRKVFCNCFAKLKQRVLWKWEVDDMPGKPENVMTVKWMPQRDVLAHPNVRLFIGHGGLLGTMEAVHSAVPMIGIPIFGDQYQNIANLEKAGAGILLEFFKITEDSLMKALHAMLEDKSSYKANSQRLSEHFRDRPASPLDTAIYWVEYVLKHNGAHHLRTAAVDLPWYQYLLFDVIATLLLLSLLVILLSVFIIKFIYRKFSTKTKQKKH